MKPGAYQSRGGAVIALLKFLAIWAAIILLAVLLPLTLKAGGYPPEPDTMDLSVPVVALVIDTIPDTIWMQTEPQMIDPGTPWFAYSVIFVMGFFCGAIFEWMVKR